MTLKRKTILGIGWSGVSQVCKIVFQFLISAILARLLTPNDYGLLAMVVVFTGFVSLFSDFGLSAAIIQKKELTEEHLSTSFWINITTGLFLMLLLMTLAPFISKFYKEPRLTLIVIVLSLNFLISSFNIVQTSLFTKNLKFKFIAIIEIITLIFSGAIAIILAFFKFGVWALVLQNIISCTLGVFLYWSFSEWKPKFIFRFQRLKELLNFGLNLTGFSLVNYFNRNLDNLIIGKILGATLLGYYNFAYKLLLFPLGNISSVLGRVMFPSLSVIQKEKEKTCDIYIKANRCIAFITFPMMIGLCVVAPEFVRVIFSSRWERSIFILQVLSIVGMVQSIGTTVGWIYQAQGRTDIMLKWGIFSFIFIGTSFFIGVRWNIEGVAIAYAIATYSILYFSFAIPFKLINLNFKRFVNSLKFIFLSTALMGVSVLLLRYSLIKLTNFNDIIRFTICVVFGIITYTLFIMLFEKNLIKEILTILNEFKYKDRDNRES